MAIKVTCDIFRPEQERDKLIHHQRNNIKWFSDLVLSKIPNARVIGIDKAAPMPLEDWMKTDISSTPISDVYSQNILYGDYVIGWEMPNNLIAYLETNHIKYIDVCLHPVRFCDKQIVGIKTNIYNLLENKIVSEEYMYEQANTYMKGYEDTFGCDTLVIGQTRIDRSLLKNERVFKLADYKSLFEAFDKNRTAFKAHPLDLSNGLWLCEDLGFKNFTEYDVYRLLSSKLIKRVIGISSSVLYEAKYFNKPAIFLQERRSLSNVTPVFYDTFARDLLEDISSIVKY